MTIDAMTYFDACRPPPRATVVLEVALPFVKPRSGGQSMWTVLCRYERGPDARVVEAPPVWRDVRLPIELPWRLRVIADEGRFEQVFTRLL